MDDHKCANCDITDVSLFACSNCKQIYYCSKACQTKDWKNRHKELCLFIETKGPTITIAEQIQNKKKIQSLGDLECANCCIKGTSFPKCSRCKVTFYCSLACQHQHWSALGGHKKFCKAVDQCLLNEDDLTHDQGDAKCTICQDYLKARSQLKLPCSHVFHHKCVVHLRESGSIKSCPLCRTPISEDVVTEMLFEYAFKEYNNILKEEVVGEPSSSIALLEKKKKEMDEVILLLRNVADHGHSTADFLLGDIYSNGLTVKKCDTEAFCCYEKAAQKGNVRAQLNIGRMYHEGKGVRVCKTKSFYWYEKAANQGDITAQIQMGLFYHIGDVVEQSETEAFSWFKKAADQGNSKCQFNIASMFENGCGVKQSYSDAASWYTKASAQGHIAAQYNLALLYRTGKGVERNDAEAARLFMMVNTSEMHTGAS